MSVGRSTLGAERGAFDHLRHADLHPAGLRAARCRLVDRAQRDFGWDYVRRCLLRVALGPLEPGPRSSITISDAGFSPAKRRARRSRASRSSAINGRLVGIWLNFLS